MKKNEIQVFQNKEFGQLEVLMIGDKPYFPATECATVLGYSNPHKAVIDHCRGDALTNREVIDNLGRKQKKKYISEGNLYRLIVRSKLPAAVKFEQFVFDEVLPSIRKTGAYITDELLGKLVESEKARDEFLNELMKSRKEHQKTIKSHLKTLKEFKDTLEENAVLKDECETLEDCIGELLPSADYCDMILQCENAIPISVIASSYGMSAVAFNRMLYDLGIQRKVGGVWILYSYYCNNGYTVLRTYPINAVQSANHTYWTQRGRRFLYDTLKEYGLSPEVER